MPLEIDPAILGQEFDHTLYGPVTAEELIAFARALGEIRPEYTEPGPSLVGHPTFCVRYKGDRFYPESIPRTINVRTGLDAGKDIQLGAPVRPGRTIRLCGSVTQKDEQTRTVELDVWLESDEGERLVIGTATVALA